MWPEVEGHREVSTGGHGVAWRGAVSSGEAGRLRSGTVRREKADRGSRGNIGIGRDRRGELWRFKKEEEDEETRVKRGY